MRVEIGAGEKPHPAVSIFNFHYTTPPDAVTWNYALNKVIGENETGFRGTKDLVYRTEAWDFLLAQQDLVQAGEPIAQFAERMALADFVDDGLDRFGVRAVIQSLQRLRQIG